MLKDLRHAVRVLLRAKGWTAIVILSLALGIGANTALFSAVNGMLLDELPVADPGSLVRLRWSGQNDMVNNSSDYGFNGKDAAGTNVRSTFSYPMFEQFRTANQTMRDLVRLRAVRAGQRRVGGCGRRRGGVSLDRELLPGARGAHGPRADDRAG